LVTQGNISIREPDRGTTYFYDVPFTTLFQGTIEATVDWTSASNTVWVLVSSGTCTVEQFQTPGCPLGTGCPCQFAVSSLVPTPKPRVLTVPSAPTGSRSLIIWNQGPGAESVSYQVVIIG
jgi:hypothetical protein